MYCCVRVIGGTVLIFVQTKLQFFFSCVPKDIPLSGNQTHFFYKVIPNIKTSKTVQNLHAITGTWSLFDTYLMSVHMEPYPRGAVSLNANQADHIFQTWEIVSDRLSKPN